MSVLLASPMLTNRRAPLVAPAGCLTPALLRRGNDTQLLHHAQLIQSDPVFYQLAILGAPDVNVLHVDLLPRGRNTLKVAFVGASEVAAGYDFIAFRKRFFHCRVHVGE